MFNSLTTFIALKFIQSKSSHGYLSFITWISILGLILGITSLIVVTSVLNGFEQTLTTRILGMVPQASIIVKKEGIEDWKEYAEKIKKSDHNVIGVAPYVRTRGMSSINGELHGSIINGIDYRYQGSVSILPKVMLEGNLESLKPGLNNIILGKSLVEERGLKLGDEVSIMIAEPDDSTLGIDPKFYSFNLSGIFSVSEELDSWMSYISIDDATRILNIANKPQGLRLKLTNVTKAEESVLKASSVLKKNNIDSKISTWKSTHQSLYDSIQMQKIMMIALLFMIILVAAFNVISALIMMTTEKKSAIAILKTIGASKTKVLKIFMIQGIIIGILGTSIGLIIGLIITYNISELSAWVNTTFNLSLFDHYYVNSLPVKIDLTELILISTTSLLICILASIYPAIKAANNNPAETLKYD